MGETDVFILKFSRPVAVGLPFHKIRINTIKERGLVITMLLFCLLLCKQSLELLIKQLFFHLVMATHHNSLSLRVIFLFVNIFDGAFGHFKTTN